MAIEIPMKLPSLNDYIRVSRGNKYASAKMKSDIEEQIGFYIKDMPRFKEPIFVHFHWVEANKRRDLDNVAFAKKFILDAMVKFGKLADDNRKCVTGFTDTFEYGAEYKVIISIKEGEQHEH